MIKRCSVVMALLFIFTMSSTMAGAIFNWPAEYKGDIGFRCQMDMRTFQNEAQLSIGTYRGGADSKLHIRYSDFSQVDPGVYEGYAYGTFVYSNNTVRIKLRFEQNDDGSMTVYQLSGNHQFLKNGEYLMMYKTRQFDTLDGSM